MCFTIATDAICCAGSTICSCACCCCKSLCGSTFKEQIKLAYITLNVAMMLFTVFCLYWLQELFENYASFIKCPASSGGQQLCLGISAVYRMSFVLAVMYLILIICMLIRGEAAKAANEGFWALKFVFIAGFFFGCLYIPNAFFEWYVEFAKVISGIYLVFQIIMLIDVFYLWGQAWIAKYEEGNESFAGLLVAASVILYGSALTLLVFNFIWYNGCGENVFNNVLNLLLIVAITGIQLLGWNPSGSLICSGSMAIYVTYETFTAQASNPKAECNKNYFSAGVMSTEIVVGFVMNIIALLYLTFATKENSSKMLKTGNGGDMTSGFLESNQQKTQDKENEEKGDEEKGKIQQPQEESLNHEQKVAEARKLVKEEELAPYESNQYIIFHTVMFITVIYMAMMITNWGAPSLDDQTLDAFQPSSSSYWIKTVTSWIAALVYVWTLVAPHLFPDRDFS